MKLKIRMLIRNIVILSLLPMNLVNTYVMLITAFGEFRSYPTLAYGYIWNTYPWLLASCFFTSLISVVGFAIYGILWLHKKIEVVNE